MKFRVGQLLESLDCRDDFDRSPRIVRITYTTPEHYLVRNVRTGRRTSLSIKRVRETLETRRGFKTVGGFLGYV